MKQEESQQEANVKLTYVTPQVEVVSIDHCSSLLHFSGDHNDAGDDNDPLHAPRFDNFPDNEGEEDL